MPEAELFLLFVRPLNRAAIRYLVTGSVAAIFYGEPRLTHDVDFVVFLTSRDVSRLAEVFPVSEFYFPPTDIIEQEISRESGGHFNLIHLATGFKADFYLTGRDDLNTWAFRLKRQVRFGSENVVLAPPEYVILRKLEYFRAGGSEKHLRDIRSMLALMGDQLDQPALNQWLGQRGLHAQWRLVSP